MQGVETLETQYQYKKISDKSGQLIDCVLVPMDHDDAAGLCAMWHVDIQKQYIDFLDIHPGAKSRADRGWNWPIFRVLLQRLISKVGETADGFIVVIGDSNDQPAPIGMVIGIGNTHCVDELDSDIGKHSFAWYLTGMPSWAYLPLGLAPVSVTKYVVRYYEESALTKPDSRGIVLHAAPSGGTRLVEFYADDCGLRNLPATTWVTVLGIPRRRDSRYFASKRELA